MVIGGDGRDIPHGVHKPFPAGGASHQLGNGHACVDRVGIKAQRVVELNTWMVALGEGEGSCRKSYE